MWRRFALLLTLMSLLGLTAMAAVPWLNAPTANVDIAHAPHVLDLCPQPAHEGKTMGRAMHGINAAARCTINEVNDDTHL
jgi:ABC-type cobalamin/Fe3+-siderophores transport system ATPase subunit